MDATPRRHGTGLQNARAGMRLAPRDDSAAGLVQPRPPGKVIISKVEDIGGAGLDWQRVGHADVVHARRSDGEVRRNPAVCVEVDMQLHQRAVRCIVGPGARDLGDTDTRGIDEVDRFARGPAQARARLCGEDCEQIGEQLCWPLGIGVGERRAGRHACAEVIEPPAMARQRLLDIAQALGARELRVKKRDQLAFRGQPAHAGVRSVMIHKPIEPIPRQHLQDLMEEAIVVPHGADPLRVRAAGKLLESQKNQRHALCP